MIIPSYKRSIAAVVLFVLLLGATLSAIAEPNGVQVISNSTEIPVPRAAASITTAGGSFTTLLLNATTQTMRWKAYVGNVTGRFVLQDPTNYTIYDWSIATVSGEVYASRNSSISWGDIRCADNAILVSEQVGLNISTTKEDSINRTFNNTVHRQFYVGTTLMQQSSCRAVATYVNNTRQSSSVDAKFQEVLLDDTQSFVYATLLENKTQGYNNQLFDFQMILAESDLNPQPQTYYFWAELS